MKLAMKKNMWRMLLLLTTIFILAGLPYIHNYTNYRMFTSSTWQGMNISRALLYVTKENKDDLLAKNKITRLAYIAPFSSPQSYIEYYKQMTPSQQLLINHGIPVLDNVLKTSVKRTQNDVNLRDYNFNHWLIPKASKEYQQNATAMIIAYPLAYIKSIVHSIYNFFGVEAYRPFPVFGLSCSWDNWFHAVAIQVFMFCVFVIAGVTFYVLGVQGEPSTRPVSLYILFCLFYVFAVSVMLESGESCVMRVPIDPFLVLGSGIFLKQCTARGIKKYRRTCPFVSSHYYNGVDLTK